MDQYEVVRNAVSAETLKLIKDSIIIAKDAQYAMNGIPLTDTKHFGDSQCPASWVSYGHPVCEALLLTIQPIMERVSGKRLFPTYSYCRIYWKDAILEKHKDRPSCQYSVSLCIDVDPEPWPFYMEETELNLNPGDLVCYKGMEITHWRKPYSGNQQLQIFLHYVDQNDKWAGLKFDERPTLGFDNKVAASIVNQILQDSISIHQQGRLNEAKLGYEKILRILPRQPDALHLLGVVARQTGKPQQAVDLISQAIKVFPSGYTFYLNLGKAYMDIEQFQEAINTFNEGLKVKSDYEEIKIQLKIAQERARTR